MLHKPTFIDRFWRRVALMWNAELRAERNLTPVQLQQALVSFRNAPHSSVESVSDLYRGTFSVTFRLSAFLFNRLDTTVFIKAFRVQDRTFVRISGSRYFPYKHSRNSSNPKSAVRRKWIHAFALALLLGITLTGGLMNLPILLTAFPIFWILAFRLMQYQKLAFCKTVLIGRTE